LDQDDVQRWIVRIIYGFFVFLATFIIMQFWAYYDWHVIFINWIHTWDWKDWIIGTQFLFLIAFLGLWITARRFKSVLKGVLHMG